jgi:hypothetical protein
MNILEPANYDSDTGNEAVIAEWQSRVAMLLDSGAYAAAHARLSESMEPQQATEILYGAVLSVVEDGPTAYRLA